MRVLIWDGKETAEGELGITKPKSWEQEVCLSPTDEHAARLRNAHLPFVFRDLRQVQPLPSWRTSVYTAPACAAQEGMD